MNALLRIGAAVLLTALSACSGEWGPAPPPKPKQPSVLDRAVEPVVKDLGGRVGPQGGIVFPSQPQP
ncbi:hypothetical protein [Inquilinus sp. CA228]|uniref:hypothetical protein n=1 Tax=Inquilinus sp. CA228 TaxID=3455609 RepID=UPI003F8D3CAC